MNSANAPLSGICIVEFAGIGPGPFAGMMLADMGAEVLRVDRQGPGRSPDPRKDITLRGRQSITLNLKEPRAVEVALRLVGQADALTEGYRPGVMEGLGLGPDVCLARNPKLVYGRMTGWGQTGPLASAAGHDINYISLSGALWAMGERDRNPMPPLNLVGDFGGGGMVFAFGLLCALLRARETGEGDIVDAAICDGAAALMAPVYGYIARGIWENLRQANFLDGAAPYYGVYQWLDGKWISIGPLEPQFYALLVDLLDLRPEDIGERADTARWAEQRERFAEVFRRRTRDDWCARLEGTDVCFAPVLDLEEAPNHPHNRARAIFVEAHGAVQPAPAPRFARAATPLPGPPPAPGEHNGTALPAWGFDDGEVADLRAAGVI